MQDNTFSRVSSIKFKVILYFISFGKDFNLCSIFYDSCKIIAGAIGDNEPVVLVVTEGFCLEL